MFDIHHHAHKTPCEAQFETQVETRKQLEALDCFKRGITELVSNYIKTMDDKMTMQDLKIQKAMNSINQDISSLVVVQEYNEETEAMDLIIKVGGAEQ